MPVLSNARIIWAGILSTHFIFIGLAYFMVQSRGDDAAAQEFPAIFGIVFVVLGLSVGVVSILLRNILAARMAERPVRMRLQVMIVGMSLAEFPSIQGFIYAMLTGDLTLSLVMIGCGLAAHILHFPLRV